MTFYVASGVANTERVSRAAAVLSALGHARTYDWTTHGSVAAEPSKRKSEVAAAEVFAISEADLVLILLPGGRGTHTELGLSLADGRSRRILVWSETAAPFDGSDGFCVFYHHPAVTRLVCPFDTLLHTLPSLI